MSQEPVTVTTEQRVLVVRELIDRARGEQLATLSRIERERQHAAIAEQWLREKLQEGM